MDPKAGVSETSVGIAAPDEEKSPCALSCLPVLDKQKRTAGFNTPIG